MAQKIIILVLALILVGFGTYSFLSKGTTSSQVTPLPTVAPVATVIPTATPSIDPQAAIIAAVMDGLVAEHGPDARNMTIIVKKIEGDYAEGMANEEHGGGMWFAANVSGQWKLVWDGNGMIGCAALAPYPKLPTDMVTQCFDEKTQEMKPR